MSTRKITAVVSGVLVLAALALGGYWLVKRTAPDTCRICQREIHAASRAVIELDGQREPVCCARCAFTFQEQKHKRVRLVGVNDYVSKTALEPASAYYVEGSHIVLCAKHEPLLDQTKHPYQPVFDRCVPSLYAFARREDAEVFAAANGGVVLRLPQLLKEVEHRP